MSVECLHIQYLVPSVLRAWGQRGNFLLIWWTLDITAWRMLEKTNSANCVAFVTLPIKLHHNPSALKKIKIYTQTSALEPKYVAFYLRKTSQRLVQLGFKIVSPLLRAMFL